MVIDSRPRLSQRGQPADKDRCHILIVKWSPEAHLGAQSPASASIREAQLDRA